MEAVDITPILDGLISILVAILSAGGVWAIRLLTKWFKLKEDDVTRAYLSAGLERIIAAVNNKLRIEADQHGHINIDDRMLAEGVRLVRDHFPDAINRFGWQQEQIEDALAARWGTSAQMDAWQAARTGESSGGGPAT